MAMAHRRLGAIHHELGEYEEARLAYSRALRLHGAILEQDPHAPESPGHVARLHADLGAVLREMGRMDEALRSFREAVQRHERLVADRPDHAPHRVGLAD